MEIQAKYTITLLNAKCQFVNSVYKILNQMNYGDASNCCLTDYYLKLSLINRLDCFEFTNQECWTQDDLNELYTIIKC